MKVRPDHSRRAARPVLQEMESRALLTHGVTPFVEVMRPALPMVQESYPILQNGEMTGLVLAFTHPMNQDSVTNIANYQFSEEINVGGKYQNVPIALSSAFYSPASEAVTLVPAHPVPIAGVASFSTLSTSDAPERITDLNGVPIDGTGAGQANGLVSVVTKPRGVSPGPLKKHRLIARISATHQNDDVFPLIGSINDVTSPFTYLFAAVSPKSGHS